MTTPAEEDIQIIQTVTMPPLATTSANQQLDFERMLDTVVGPEFVDAFAKAIEEQLANIPSTSRAIPTTIPTPPAEPARTAEEEYALAEEVLAKLKPTDAFVLQWPEFKTLMAAFEEMRKRLKERKSFAEWATNANELAVANAMLEETRLRLHRATIRLGRFVHLATCRAKDLRDMLNNTNSFNKVFRSLTPYGETTSEELLNDLYDWNEEMVRANPSETVVQSIYWNVFDKTEKKCVTYEFIEYRCLFQGCQYAYRAPKQSPPEVVLSGLARHYKIHTEGPAPTQTPPVRPVSTTPSARGAIRKRLLVRAPVATKAARIRLPQNPPPPTYVLPPPPAPPVLPVVQPPPEKRFVLFHFVGTTDNREMYRCAKDRCDFACDVADLAEPLEYMRRHYQYVHKHICSRLTFESAGDVVVGSFTGIR